MLLVRSWLFASALAFMLTPLIATADHHETGNHENWAASVVLPDGEKAVPLFNGKDLSGWRKRADTYFSVEDGMIRAANTEAVPASTYLYTAKAYRNFRLLMEVKQTMRKGYSTMHSAVAALGTVKPNSDQDPYGFSGPLLMFCHDWGIWGADGRKRVYPPGHKGPVHRPPYEKVGKWNQLEFLAVGNRIRVVANGQLSMDYTEKDPKLVQECPLGLQLHGNHMPQEWRFRGLLLVEDPQDELVTLRY